MDEKKEEKVEKKPEEKTEDKAVPAPSEEAGTEEEQAIVKEAKDAATIAKEAEELKAKNLEKEEKLLDRKEALNALGGGSPAGDRPEKAEETDEEYTERFQKGEVNPFKDDGTKGKAE